MTRTAPLCIGLCVLTMTVAFAAKQDGKPAYTDPARAAAEDPDFAVQGEYAGEIDAGPETMKAGMQVIALGEGKFAAVALRGGLPGDGWSGDPKDVRVGHGQREDGKVVLRKPPAKDYMVIADGALSVYDSDGKLSGTLRRVDRKSPTLGAKPPAGAVVLFDGKNADAWKGGKLDGDLLTEGCSTKQKFGSFTLHLEFRLPYKPHTFPSSQDRGNSGVYTFNRYETQVLDSFGLHYPEKDWAARFEKDFGRKPASQNKQWCGAFYKFKLPDVNMCYPPLAWQTYDIDFTAPKFDAEGNKTANARFTTRHNGVVIHDDVELPKGTGAGGGRKEVAEESIYLQGHGNPVRFRNIWIVPK